MDATQTTLTEVESGGGRPDAHQSFRRRWRRRAAVLLAALSLLGVSMAASGPAAQASYAGYIYISVPSWAGNCPSGGSPIGAYGVVDVMGQAMDFGDDLVYVRARIGDYNTITARAYCSRSWSNWVPYWGPTSQHRIYVNRNGQTVWQGPFGVWKN